MPIADKTKGKIEEYTGIEAHQFLMCGLSIRKGQY